MMRTTYTPVNLKKWTAPQLEVFNILYKENANKSYINVEMKKNPLFCSRESAKLVVNRIAEL